MADEELLVIELALGIAYSIIYYLHINESVSLSLEKLAHRQEKRMEWWWRDVAAPGGFREFLSPRAQGQYWPKDERINK